MKTIAQIANDAKIRLQQDIIQMLRAEGEDARHETWRHIEFDTGLSTALATYHLSDKERRSHLNKIAFPDANNAEVDAALKAGNNLRQIYKIARGRAFLRRDSSGRFVKGTKGLKVVTHQRPNQGVKHRPG